MEKQENYFLLPWYKKLWVNLKDKLKEKKQNFKFPWVKLMIFVLVIVAIVTLIALIVNAVEPFYERPLYNKEGFVEISDFTDDTVKFENDRYKFELDSETTHFTLTDKQTGSVWKSNPQDKTDVDTLTFYYSKGLGEAKELGNYDNSIDYDGNKCYSFRVDSTAKSVEVLYVAGGKNGKFDYTDFPTKISIEKFNDYYSQVEAYIEELEAAGQSTSQAKSDLKNFDKIYNKYEDQGYYLLANGSTLGPIPIGRLTRIFYTYLGYTTEKLAEDNAEFGVVVEKVYPTFEASLKYTLTDKGLDIELVNDSLRDYSDAPLIYIDVLPFLGAASTTDEGYAMIPDGSGVLIDFNNNRSYATRYEQRIYGRDYGKTKKTTDFGIEKISMPVYGMKVNDHGFINIIKEGSESCSIISSSSSRSVPYNQTYYRYYNREKDTYKFTSMSNMNDITSWTTAYNESDLVLELRSMDNSGDYSNMAKEYQKYLLENNLLSKKDTTTNIVLNLTLIGGYIEDTNFLGFPYSRVRSLTNYEQVLEISNKLNNDGITGINLFYEGFTNDGIKSTYIGNMKFNNVITSRSNLKKLNEQLTQKNINFYPTFRLSTAYTDKNLNKNDVVRNMFGDTMYRYDTNEAAYYQDPTSTELLTLSSRMYQEVYDTIAKKMGKIGIQSIGMIDMGSEMYGSYQKKNIEQRSEVLENYHKVMEQYSNKFTNIANKFPNDYALRYLDVALDIPVNGTNYQIVKTSVPFYQMVLSGCIDYSNEDFNFNDQYSFNYYKMKAIETGSNISMLWTYDNTIDLIGTEYDKYYSTYYMNWYDETLALINEINSLNIYNTSIASHEFLTTNCMVAKTTYDNGISIVFNYQNNSYNYGGIVVQGNSYYVERG